LKRKKYQRIINERNEYSESLIQLTEYDKSKQVVKEMNYDELGQLYSMTTINYKENSQVLEKKLEYFQLKSIENVKYKYSSNDKLESITHFMNNDQWEKVIYNYDDKSRLIEKIEFNADEIISKKIITDYEKKTIIEYEYDTNGNVVVEIIKEMSESWKVLKEIEIVYQGILEGKSISIYSYDNKDQFTNLKIYEEDKLVLNEDYFFNSEGIEIRSLGYDYSDGSKIEIIREVGNEGKITKEDQFINDLLEFSTEKEYNRKGDLLVQKKWVLSNDEGFEESEEFIYKYEE